MQFDERQSYDSKETNNDEEILRQKRYNELFGGIVDLNNRGSDESKDDTLKYTVDNINDTVIVTINNNAPNKLDSITPFYKVINDDIHNLREIDKEKSSRNIIKVYLVGNDDNILKLKGEIEDKSGNELLVSFYKQQDGSYQNLGYFYTSTDHLLHVLSQYTHYFSIDDQSLKHICSSNDSDIQPTYKQSDDVAYHPHQTSIKQNIIQKPEKVPERPLNDREFKTYNPNKKNPNSYEFIVENNDLHNEEIDSEELKFKGQKDNVQYGTPNYNNIYLENNKTNTEFDIKEHPKDETEVLLRGKTTNVETIAQYPVPCNTNIKDELGRNIQFPIPHTIVPNLYNKSPSPKPYLPWNIANFNNYGKPCSDKDKNISNTNPTGCKKFPSEIEERNKKSGDKLNSAIQKLSEKEINKKNQGVVTITPILPVSVSPLPTPYFQTNLNPVLNIPYILPRLQNLPIKSSVTTPSFNQKAIEKNYQNKINEALGKPKKSNINQSFPHSLTSSVNNILSKPMISSPLQIVPTNVCNVPELTIGKNSENNMFSTGLSPPLASLACSSETPETPTMSSSALPISELTPPCTEILSEPKLPPQGILTTMSDIPKMNSLPICDIPSVVPNLIESVSSTLEAPPLHTKLVTPITETLIKPMSSLVNAITKLDVPSINVIKENDISLSKVSCTDVLEKDAPQIIANIKDNVPKIPEEKDSKNFTQMLEFSTNPTTTNEASVTPIMPTPCLEYSLTPPCSETSEINTPPQIVSTTISNISDANIIKNATTTDSNINFPEITNQNTAPTTIVKSPHLSPNFSNLLTSSINPVDTLQTLSKSLSPNSIKDHTNSISSSSHIVQKSPNRLYFPSINTTRPHNLMFEFPPSSYPNLFYTTKPMSTSHVNTSPKFILPNAYSIIKNNSSRKLLAVPSITIPAKSNLFGALLSTKSSQPLSNNGYFDGNVPKIGDALLTDIPILPPTASYPTTDHSRIYSPLPQELPKKFNLNPSNVYNLHLFNPKQSGSFNPLSMKSHLSPQELTSYFTPETLSNLAPCTKSRYFPSSSQTKSHPYMDSTCKPLNRVLFPSAPNKIPITKSFSNQNQPHMHFSSKLPDNLPILNLPIDSVPTNTINNRLTYLPLNKNNPKKIRPPYHLPLKSDYCKSSQKPLSSTASPLNLNLEKSYYNFPPSHKSKVIYPHVPSIKSPEYSSKVFKPRVLATPTFTAIPISKTPVSPWPILPTMNYGSNTEINAKISPPSNLFLPVSSTKDATSELYATSNLGKQNLNPPIPTLPTSVSKAETPDSITSLPTTLDAIFGPTSFKAPVSSLNMNSASVLSSPITTAPKLMTTSFNHPSLVFPYASSVELSPTISPSAVSSLPIASTSNVEPNSFKIPAIDLPIPLTKKDSTINAQSISSFPSAAASWPITSTVGVTPINNMPPFSPFSLRVTPGVCATQTKKPTSDIPIRPSTEVCVKNSPPFVPTCPISPTPKLRMSSYNPWMSCLSMPSSRKSDLAELPNYVSSLPIFSTQESKSINLLPSKSLLPVPSNIETNSEVPVLSAPQISAFPKKILGSTSYSFNIPSSDSKTSDLDLTDLLARSSPLPVVPYTVTAQPKSKQCFYYPKKTLLSSRVSANEFNMQPQFIKICNKPDYSNLKSVTQPQSTNTSMKYSQLFDYPHTYHSPINYFKPKVVLTPQSSPDLNSDFLTESYAPMSYSYYVAPNVGSNLFWNNLSYKSDPGITCSNNNPDKIGHYHYPTYKSSVALTKPNLVPKFRENQEIQSSQENKYSNSYLSNVGDEHQKFKLSPSETRPPILTSNLSKKSKLKFNYTSPDNLSPAPTYYKENVIKLSPYKVQNKFSNGKTSSPCLSPDKKPRINFDTKYSMNTPNLYRTFNKFIPSNLKVLPDEKLSNTFILTPPSIGLTHNNLNTYDLGPHAYDVCLPDKKVTIPIANLCIAKYEPNRFEKFNIKTDNPDIELKMWLSKTNSYKAKLIVEEDESNVINFIPIVKNKAYYSPEYIRDTVKKYVEKYYGKPIVLNGTYSLYNPFALINVNEIKNDDLYVIWPTFCECGCKASGCQCCCK